MTLAHRFGSLDREVVAIGQGTWQMQHERREAVTAIRRGLDLGMTHIDTAEMYTGSEEIIAEAIAGRRGEVFLVSKVLPQNATRSGMISACEKSLRKLKTDRLDVYLLHWRGNHALEETVLGFEELERSGKIRAWGVSNFDTSDLDELRAIAKPGRPVCNQVLYHLEERGIEHDVLPWCEAHQVALVGYSPFGSGRFPSPKSAGGRALAEIAAAHAVTSRQVALAFLVRRPSLFTIPKASNPDHAAENAGAEKLRLTDADLAKIDAAFPRGKRPRSLPLL
jgi:diketogulonate reductase-like aldo/keto reductase